MCTAIEEPSSLCRFCCWNSLSITNGDSVHNRWRVCCDVEGSIAGQEKSTTSRKRLSEGRYILFASEDLDGRIAFDYFMDGSDWCCSTVHLFPPEVEMVPLPWRTNKVEAVRRAFNSFVLFSSTLRACFCEFRLGQQCGKIFCIFLKSGRHKWQWLSC